MLTNVFHFIALLFKYNLFKHNLHLYIPIILYIYSTFLACIETQFSFFKGKTFLSEDRVIKKNSQDKKMFFVSN